MELILAEKPSAARNFAKALGGKTGNYAGTEYKITNLRGHVMGLLPPDKQVPTEKVEFYKSWDLENLPWNLNDFAWKKGILSGCKDIISGLKDELKEADCVVIATDVDPSGEGELLAWEALEKCGWRGPTKRMYFADEAPASVQKAFMERKTLPSMDKDGDYVKAVVRERWDLASMQFTRAATLVARKKGFRTVVRQGRLKSVMVKLTGDQLKAYNEYVRKPFYEARFKDENGNIFARKTDDAEDIRFDSPDQVDLSQLHDSAVVEDSRAKKHTAPGKLLDLAGLSAILAKQGFKPANVLKTYQEMYENQIVSYPRTEDKEVTPEQFGELLPLVDKIAGVVGVDTSLLSHRAARKTHTTPRHTSISGTMVFKTPISALEFMFITSCAEASITGPHLTEFFLVELQVSLIPSWAVISTQKSIKLPSTRTCPCSARSSRSFRMPSRVDINVWMSMPQDSPPARSFIFTVRTEAERIIRSAISSWASARWTNEAVSHSPSSRPM